MEFNDNWALKLAAAIAVIFIMQSLFHTLTQIYLLDSQKVVQQPWTLITSIFLHADLTHLLLNGFALVIFGMILENIIGSRKFLIYFFATGIAASIIFVLGVPIVQMAQGASATSALGASGAIFGIMGVLAVLRPNLVVYIGFFPMPMWLAAIIWALQDFFGIFIPSNIANFAHLGGLFLGILIGLSLTGGKIEIGKKNQGHGPLSEDELSRWEKENM